MEPKKVQKQGRDERTQEDYPTSGVYFCRCRVVFLRSFISALFLYFFRLHPYLKSGFTETFFPSRLYMSPLAGRTVIAFYPNCPPLLRLQIRYQDGCSMGITRSRRSPSIEERELWNRRPPLPRSAARAPSALSLSLFIPHV